MVNLIQNWPQWLVIFMTVMSFGVGLGKTIYIPGNQYPVSNFAGNMVVQLITLFILWRGGFFAPIGWPA